MSSERTEPPPSIAPKNPAPRNPVAGGASSDDSSGLRPVTRTTPADGSGVAPLVDKVRSGWDSLRSKLTTPAPRPATRSTAAPAARVPAGAGTARTEPARPAAATSSGGARKVRLAVARIDPWSVMKLSFLLSVAIGIMIVVAAAVVWQTLDNMAVFTSVNETIATITDDPDFFNLLEYAAFSRVISLATMIAVVDVVLLTALSTIGAFLYNIVAALVGGVTVTLTDD